MNIAAIREKIRRIGFFVPFRIHFLLLLIALLLAYRWLLKNNAVPETSRTAIINVFITVTFWFALGILVLSFFSAFISWIFFLFSKKNKKSILNIKTSTQSVSDKQLVEISISKIFKPLFGYIRLRLCYDKNNISPKFAPIRMELKKHLFSMQTKGVYNWPLKNIKEYDISSGIIYFEDFFQFFSFTSQLSVNSNFYTQPLKAATPKVIVQPKKTEDTNMRIEEMRKVEGEYLNYKNFETNDDVRRIVWKIYAKNKELVVRIPETNDPYASHIYFYASFYNAVSNDVYEEFNIVFLDDFKTFVWNVYEQLYRQSELIQYIPDQQTKTFYADDVIQKTKYIISTSSWQKQNNLDTYFNKQYASVLCISSLTDAKQLEDVLEKTGKTLTVVFIELSKSFSRMKVTDWLQWIFINPEKNSSEKMQLAFTLSPLRKKILDNEKNIKELLKISECESLILEA
ncbi:DUF58 domain-containing protein [Ginsengibacter hankyongi]|uniref:DUF58 domain-containing protein n=1 Tax=Ginsengibacter hankyongi TaxID=2607284 RepID=A0A5J5IHN1_9BACT|nr:DUF58 domain-containing protein [Ginsengibacter hankyongi]KAA9038610.1 DUF58 domain-containing protein [Ginsengibacter hankyongi]